MKSSTETMTLALIAIVAASGLIGVVAIDIDTPLQDVEGHERVFLMIQFDP